MHDTSAPLVERVLTQTSPGNYPGSWSQREVKRPEAHCLTSDDY
jgi:hypothetical protein